MEDAHPAVLPVSEHPLFQAHPALRGSIPHRALGTFPTPVERASDLGNRLGIASLWVKRDDWSGTQYGGGKVRKLEHCLAEAIEKRARVVVTFGGVGSNHAVATAIYAKQLGLHAVLVLLPEPADERVREHLLAMIHFGAEIRVAPKRGGAEAIARRIERDRAEPVHVIPAGGSSVLGNIGFVNAAFELAEQVRRGEMPEPDVVYMAMGTMGSVVGLAIGLRAAGLATRVVAVRASSPGTSSESRMMAMAGETEGHLRRLDPSFPEVGIRSGDISIDARQLGAGYGQSTRKGGSAIAMGRDHAGIELEPVYTGKALAALIEEAPSLSRKVVLFWHSHNARKLVLGAADPASLPPELHGYFGGTRR
ncbi:1-aminocyclopropane-1-carboxylate deaminase [Minicystis rosea]|nr:1-aminocyclopropane-1-carboxylate deaminase [Minicystis rosea]